MSNFKLFYKIFLINLFTFGGGYTIIPILKQTFVEELKVIKDSDMKNIIALSNSVPGALAVSASFLVGYKINGFKGSVLAVIAAVTPCILVIGIIFNIYNLFITNLYIKSIMEGIGVTVSSVLFFTAIKMFINLLGSKLMIFIFAFSFITSYFLNFNIVIILMISSILGSGIIKWNM